MTYIIGSLSFPWCAAPRDGHLTSQEILKRGYRVIGGDKGDVHFSGYYLNGSTTVLVGVELLSELDLTTEEAHDIAVEVVESAYESIGTECVEHSLT